MEYWKDIKDYEGIYQISNLGRVRRLTNNKGFIRQEPLIVKLGDKKGYPKVNLWKNNVSKTYAVHKLIMEMFVGPRPIGLMILHNNGNPKDCYLDNLRYGTQLENSADAIKHGVQPRGEKQGSSKLTEQQVLEIKQKYVPRVYTQKQLAEEYGISFQHVSAIVRGVFWTHLKV